MKNHFTWKTPCLLAGILALSACSGGGGGDDSAPQLPSYDNIERLVVGGKIGYQTKNDHKQLLAPKWDAAHPFASNNIARVIAKGKWQYIDRSGKVLLDAVEKGYDWIYDFDDNGIARYVKGGKFGLLDNNFKEIVSADTHDYYRMSAPLSGVYVVSSELPGGHQYGLLAADGTELLAMTNQEIATDPASDFARVKDVTGKYGCYNIKEKKTTIAARFDNKLDCSTADYVVGTSSHQDFLIDKKTDQIASIAYQKITYYPENQLFVGRSTTVGQHWYYIVPIADANKTPTTTGYLDVTAATANNHEKQAFFSMVTRGTFEIELADSAGNKIAGLAGNHWPVIYYDAQSKVALVGMNQILNPDKSVKTAAKYFVYELGGANADTAQPLAGTWTEVEYAPKRGLLKLSNTSTKKTSMRPISAPNTPSHAEDYDWFAPHQASDWDKVPAIVGQKSGKTHVVANASGILAQPSAAFDLITINTHTPDATRHIARDGTDYLLIDNNGKPIANGKKHKTEIFNIATPSRETADAHISQIPGHHDYFYTISADGKTAHLLDKNAQILQSIQSDDVSFESYEMRYDPANHLFIANNQYNVVFDASGKKYGESISSKFNTMPTAIFDDAGLRTGLFEKSATEKLATIVNSAGDIVFQTANAQMDLHDKMFNKYDKNYPLLEVRVYPNTFYINTLGKCVIQIDKTACPAGM